MSDGPTPVAAWIAETLPPLLSGLEALETLGRRLHPPVVGEVIAKLGVPEIAIQTQLSALEAVPWPEHLIPVRTCLQEAASAVAGAFPKAREALRAPEGVLGVYQALGAWSRACEALYPLAPVLLPVSQYFVEDSARGDMGLLGRLSTGGLRGGGENGLLHGGGEPGTRGGFSLYVPETYDPDTAHPLIMALHGGGGNGRRFLWTWLRAARTRGAILMAPTSLAETWSLTQPEEDGTRLLDMRDAVAARWRIDPDRQLLTGISDGGTFSYLVGFNADSPFTHIAPIAASFHPILLSLANPEKLRSVPVHLTHGVLDWMFPVDMAREAVEALGAAGAGVTYSEIEDLSHTYPAERNGPVLDWMGVPS
ncbi:MAG: phospholipase [Alphaproteobacteria bacterium]